MSNLPGMKRVEITISFDVQDFATDKQLDYIAGTALVQVDEPADEEGEDMPFFTQCSDYTIKVDGREIA